MGLSVFVGLSVYIIIPGKSLLVMGLFVFVGLSVYIIIPGKSLLVMGLFVFVGLSVYIIITKTVKPIFISYCNFVIPLTTRSLPV